LNNSPKNSIEPEIIEKIKLDLYHLIRRYCKSYKITDFEYELFLHDSTRIEYIVMEIAKVERFISIVNYYWSYFPFLISNLSFDEGVISVVTITEQGIKEVEAARENKETPVEKYPPGAINQIVNYGPMIGSPIIQGSSNTYNVQSNVNIIGNDIQKIKKFIDSVRKEYQNYDLDYNKKSEIEADLNSMDSQILSPKPKVSILKEISLNVWDIVKPFASEAVKQVGMSLLGRS
jgi:hypothetical protein